MQNIYVTPSLHAVFVPLTRNNRIDLEMLEMCPEAGKWGPMFEDSITTGISAMLRQAIRYLNL